LKRDKPDALAVPEAPNMTWSMDFMADRLGEAQDHATQWLWTYNNDRPNMGIGGITPAMKLTLAA
jgi:putative transposase